MDAQGCVGREVPLPGGVLGSGLSVLLSEGQPEEYYGITLFQVLCCHLELKVVEKKSKYYLS